MKKASLSALGVLLLLSGISSANAQSRIVCSVDHPTAASMRCPDLERSTSHRRTIWAYDQTFRGSKFPSGLKIGDTLLCTATSDSQVEDCVVHTRS